MMKRSKSQQAELNKIVARERHRLNKQLTVEYLGGKCQMCGIKSMHYEIYDVHHPDGKDEILKMNGKWKNLLPKLDGLVLLCANCHRILHAGVRNGSTLKINF